MNKERIREIAGEVLEAEVEAAELYEAKKKGKKKDDGTLPGPLIGYLMKKGVIGRKGKKYKKPGSAGKMIRTRKGSKTRDQALSRSGKRGWKKG